MSWLIMAVTWSLAGEAQVPVPVSTQSWQLQQLINKSEEQLKSVKEILVYSQRDAGSVEKAARILESLSAGIDKSIERYQGTPIYEKALLELQVAEIPGPEAPLADPEQKHFRSFQDDSVKANLADLGEQKKMAEALRSAGEGFIPKLQTQAQIGNWQASTRVSAQLTELLSSVQSLRRDLRSSDTHSGGLAELVSGSQMQNQKQREGLSHGK